MVVTHKEETYVIAEAGINHLGDLSIAKKMITKAKKYGADAIKFQTYNTDERVHKKDPLYDTLKQCELPLIAFSELKKHADKQSIDFISTPFDENSLNALVKLKVRCIKIASFDVVNYEFIRLVAEKRIPVIMSTGMASLTDINKAVNIFENKNTQYSLLHCVSSYPAPLDSLNLNRIKTLKDLFRCKVGYSDHSGHKLIPALAVSMGAEIIEIHFGINVGKKLPDEPVTLMDSAFQKAVQYIRDVERIKGTGHLEPQEVERSTAKYRRYTK